GIENSQRLAINRGPGAGRRIAAPDQPVYLLSGLAPVDFGIARAATAFVGRFRVVLFDTWRLAGFHQIDRFHHSFDAHREQAIEIDGAERVGGGDRRLFLDENIAGIEPVVGPEYRQPSFLFALDDRPVDGASAAIGRQQRRVI